MQTYHIPTIPLESMWEPYYHLVIIINKDLQNVNTSVFYACHGKGQHFWP